MALDFFIDIEDGAGVRLGSGPITSASAWSYTARMARAGSFAFEMPATDAKAALVERKRIARAYTHVDGQRIEVGAGIIDRIERVPQLNGDVTLRVSGDDLLRELTYRSVLDLKLYAGGNPVSHAAAVAAVSSFAPAGWTFAPDASPPNDSIYAYFNGDTVLAALVKIGEKSYNQFYRGAGRTVVFTSAFEPSGLRAVSGVSELAPGTCAIVDLAEQIDTYDMITRIYPRGSGNADAQLTLRNTTRSAPSGYTLDASANYIEHDAATATYGRIERQIDYREIGPISNTDADMQAASNALFDAALETLRRYSTETEQATYRLQLAECPMLLRPMQSMHVEYRNLEAGMNIKQTLNILETTWQIDAEGLRTTALVVTSGDRWPNSDMSVLVDTLAQGRVYQALPQLSANSYVTAYTKNVDQDHHAAFRFRFGDEVTQIQQVLFEFQVLPFESTVLSVGTETGGSALSTGGPSVNSTGAGGNDTTGPGGGGSTGSAGGGNTGSAGGGDTGSAGGGVTGSSGGGFTGLDGGGTTGSAGGGNTGLGGGGTTGSGGGGNTGMGGGGTTGSGGGGTTGSGGGGTTGSGGGGTTGGQGLTTNAPTGGDIIADGRHTHPLTIGTGVGSEGNVTLHHFGGGIYGLRNASLSGGRDIFTLPSGDHTHEVNSHTHTIDAHGHSLSPHSHSVDAHTHSVDAHSHSIDAHSHAVSDHTHTMSAHTHTIDSHTHTVSAHAHSIPDHTHTVDSHTHTVSAHTHTISEHTHTLSDHTHSLNNHTHDLSEGITAIYGIYRESLLATYVAEELEYRVNGGTWSRIVDDVVNAGDGWLQLDLTAAITSPTIIGRPLYANNMLEIRASGLPATIGYADSELLYEVYISGMDTSRYAVGDNLRVSEAGAPFDGDYLVTATDFPAAGWLQAERLDEESVAPYQGYAATVTRFATATLDAQLSVRNVIQAIAYV